MTWGIRIPGSGHGELTTVDMALDRHTLEAASPAERAPLSRRQSLRLQALVDQNFDFAWRSLRRLGVTEPNVDDATQQLFLVVASKLDVIEPGRERSFIFGAAVRIASDSRRALGRERERTSHETDALCDPLPEPDELLDQKRARELLDRLLDALPMELRTVLVLAEGEGMTMSEIARLCELPPGTVASRLRRARAAVLAKLKPNHAARGAGDTK
jgi:RNA polymerase sigma-70 factor, ECF subfamily